MIKSYLEILLKKARGTKHFSELFTRRDEKITSW